jgi:hypothetical protein
VGYGRQAQEEIPAGQDFAAQPALGLLLIGSTFRYNMLLRL